MYAGDFDKIAWAAGFFEGEGCLSIYGPNKKSRPDYLYPRLRITQHHDPECLYWFKEAVGCGIVDGPRLNQKGDRVVYQYSVGGSRAIDVIKKLRPMLTDGGKGGQMDEILTKFGDRKWKVYGERNE